MKTFDPDKLIKHVESKHFRTNQDTGAHPSAMLVWNEVRSFFKLPSLKKDDLPRWCGVHKKYHLHLKEYGCCEWNLNDEKTKELLKYWGLT